MTKKKENQEVSKSVIGANTWRVDQARWHDDTGRQHNGVLITLTNDALSVSTNVLLHPENAKDFAALVEMTAHDIYEQGGVAVRH